MRASPPGRQAQTDPVRQQARAQADQSVRPAQVETGPAVHRAQTLTQAKANPLG
jgi:hypothetical protein